ncbi:InlB B-repeat-containing protein, partial [Candidatus Saccharibacteria bacterium]|nr:InlB B-repeat-containing protein [Candidatus Saccharibacteria bacterium]
EYTKVAHRDSSTDIGEDAEGATLTTTYASYISKTQAAGAYSGKVIYTLVHPSNEEPLQPQPAKPGKIVYHPNNSSVVGTMGDQSASNNTDVTLWASNFKRDGYGFAGWNTAYDYSGTFYGPNQTITAPSDVQTNGLSLYAVWIKSAGSLQNWNGCSSLASGATTALTDERDGNTYAVAKLADNKCWTIENLRLDDSAELSSSNTHNPSLPLTNSWWYSSANDSDTKPTSNHLSATTDPTTTAWCKTDSSNCDDQSMLATNNTVLFTNNAESSYSPSSYVYSYGNYYNWYSVTAGHGTYSKFSGNTSGDICPAGWHLPTGDTSGEYNSLNTALSGTDTGTTASNNLRSYPNNFVYSGYVLGSSVDVRNAHGDYWSSSTNSIIYAYNLYLYSSSVYPGANYNAKYFGGMARCVAGT